MIYWFIGNLRFECERKRTCVVRWIDMEVEQNDRMSSSVVHYFNRITESERDGNREVLAYAECRDVMVVLRRNL